MGKSDRKIHKPGKPGSWAAIPRLSEEEIRAAHERGDRATVEAQACRLVHIKLKLLIKNRVLPAWLFAAPGALEDFSQAVAYGRRNAADDAWLPGVVTVDLPKWDAGKMKFGSWIMTQTEYRASDERKHQEASRARQEKLHKTLDASQRRTLSLDSHGQEIGEAPDRVELQRSLVARAQRRLGQKDKDLFTALALSGDNTAAAARTLGIPVRSATEQRRRALTKLQENLPRDWQAQAEAYDAKVKAELAEAERQSRMDLASRARIHLDAARALFRDTAIATPILRAQTTQGLEGAVIRGSFDATSQAARVAAHTVTWRAEEHDGRRMEDWFQRIVFREFAGLRGLKSLEPKWEPSFRGWLARMVPSPGEDDLPLQVARICAWADRLEAICFSDAVAGLADLDTGEPLAEPLSEEDRQLARNWREFRLELPDDQARRGRRKLAAELFSEAEVAG